jgi:hypothetical protein
LKTKVFETKPRTIADLKQRIQEEVAAIPVEMLREVMIALAQLYKSQHHRFLISHKQI